MTELLDFWREWLPSLLEGLLVSLHITAASLVLGFPLALLLAIGVKSKLRPIRWGCLAFVEVGRGAPALILLQFAYFGLPSAGWALTSFWAGTLALGWSAASYLSEIIRGGLEAVPDGQREAAFALGLSHMDEMRYIILPQGLRVALPSLLGQAILVLQASSLCFTIALPELVSRAYSVGANTFQYMPILALAAVLYTAICVPATLALAAMERRLGKHDA